MPSITIDEINKIKSSLHGKYEYPYFVETGTLIGNSLNNLRGYFKKLRSVELLKEFYDISVNRKLTEHWYNVELYFGDSSKLLPRMVEDLDDNIIFFLDGHRSGGHTNNDYKDVPLLEELKIIKEIRYKYNDLIIIDDYGLFGTNHAEDWKAITIENINNILENKSYYEYNDRVIITN